MTLIQIKLLALCVITLPSLALALPVDYAPCSSATKIKSPKETSEVFFNEDCTELFVLPPRSGRVTLTNYAPVSDLPARCEAFTAIQNQISAFPPLKFKEGATADEWIEQIEKQKAIYIQLEKLQDRLLEMTLPIVSQTEFRIESRHQEMIAAYKILNPDLKVIAMPLEQQFISFNEVDPESADPRQMAPILSLQLNAQLVPSQPSNIRYFTEGVTGSFAMSVNGACVPDAGIRGPSSVYVVANLIYSFWTVHDGERVLRYRTSTFR